MHPSLFVYERNIEENKNERRIIRYENCDKKLCNDLCGVFCIMSGVCSVYLLFLMHFASESNIVNISLT